MISIMELMEKKTLLTKKNNSKKGMTLVEIMAAMAILSILFIGISTFIIGIVNSEAKANRKLESDGYLKSALLMFESGVVSPSDSLNFTVGFNNIEEMKKAIKEEMGEGIADSENTDKNNSYKYEITIIINSYNQSNIYKIEAIFKNSRNEEYTKHIYI